MSEMSSTEILFFAALEKPTLAERSTFLDEACSGDAALRAWVERLLVANSRVGKFLEPLATEEPDVTLAEPSDATGAYAPDARRPARTMTDVFVPSDAMDLFGDTRLSVHSIGVGPGAVIACRYILESELGTGGMGIVYRATQIEPVRRQVALKLIKGGSDSKAVVARFEAERQALALMEHSNIARVYDGGTTPSGEPFFVMELVKGIPLTRYCDTFRLTVKARLALFVQVCQAVQHAHQKGIIHRDLKPGNVLVTEVDGRPTPKVIDFGVAKATALKFTDNNFEAAGVIVGTPAYMSPEQADPTSTDIDTRTDVYSLGVILYELLVGSPPIDKQ